MSVLATGAARRSGKETSDGLARPVDYGARRGAGNDRVLVLGGGGIFFIACRPATSTGCAGAASTWPTPRSWSALRPGPWSPAS